MNFEYFNACSVYIQQLAVCCCNTINGKQIQCKDRWQTERYCVNVGKIVLVKILVVANHISCKLLFIFHFVLWVCSIGISKCIPPTLSPFAHPIDLHVHLVLMTIDDLLPQRIARRSSHIKNDISCAVSRQLLSFKTLVFNTGNCNWKLF